MVVIPAPEEILFNNIDELLGLVLDVGRGRPEVVDDHVHEGPGVVQLAIQILQL
jgi:hypothetical protein